MKALLTRLRQHWCRHAVFIEDMQRLPDGNVEARCHRCAKALHAPYGLALPALIEREKKT